MRKSPSLLLATAVLLPCFAPFAHATNDLEQEYVQVRKIALKDAKVQEAFQKANERLNDKILEIDPALRPIVEGAHLQQFQAPSHRETVVAKPVAARVHAVESGETLGSIAVKYHVTVAELEKANHIADVHKLQVGQKVTIPTAR